MLAKAKSEVREEEVSKTRKAFLEAIQAGAVFFRMQGFTAWEIARKLSKDLTPGQIRGTAATMLELDETDVARELDKLAERAERDAEEAEAARRKRDRVDTYYICDEDGAILAIAERVSYAYALMFREDVAEKYGADPETLDVLTEGEYGEGDV